MSKCPYKLKYWDNKQQQSISYFCSHPPLKTPDEDGEKRCIFHSKRDDKNVKKFYKEFKKLYESNKHDFMGFIFPDGFSFKKLKEETGSLEFKESNFSDTTFLGETYFEKATFLGKAHFNMAIFSRAANFRGAIFSEEVTFVKTTFFGDTDFWGATFSGEAHYNKAIFSGVTNYRGTTFLKGVDFNRANFRGGVYFVGATFSELVDFGESTSSEMASFRSAIFLGVANFGKSTFLEKVSFREVTFSKKAFFDKVNFSCDGGTSFIGAKFSGEDGTSFIGVQFSGKGKISFSNAKFSDKGGTHFSNTKFFSEDGTDFSRAKFSKEPIFYGVIFSENPDFSETKLAGKPDFNWMEFLKKNDCFISISDKGLKKVIIEDKIKTKSPSIFLSHSSIDKPFVMELAKRLEKFGVKIWIDEAEIQIGDSLIEKIGNAVVGNDYVIAIISYNSIKSKWVKKELEIAMTKEIEHKKIIVLPLLIEKIKEKDMPPFLIGKLYADFTSPDKYEKSFSKVLRKLGIKMG